MATEIWPQAITLASVGVGGLISYGTAMSMERARIRKEEATRWMTARLEAYSEYLFAVKRVFRVSRELYLSRERGAPIPDVAALSTELQEFENERSTMFEKVVLLASEDTIKAGLSLNSALAELEGRAKAGSHVEPEQWAKLCEVWLDKMNAFQEVARADLRVGGSFDRSALLRPSDYGPFLGRRDESRPSGSDSPAPPRVQP